MDLGSSKKAKLQGCCCFFFFLWGFVGGGGMGVVSPLTIGLGFAWGPMHFDSTTISSVANNAQIDDFVSLKDIHL